MGEQHRHRADGFEVLGRFTIEAGHNANEDVDLLDVLIR